LKNIGLKRTASSGYLKPTRIKWVPGIWTHWNQMNWPFWVFETHRNQKNHQFRVSKHLWNWRIAGSRQSKKTIGIRKPLVPIISKTSKNRRVSWKNWSFSGLLFDFFKSWEPGLYIKN
jgi:hypothetical protein